MRKEILVKTGALETNLAEKESIIEDLRNEILNQSRELESSLTKKENIIEQMRKEISTRAGEIEGLEKQISEIRAQSARLDELVAFEKSI